jgi:hypothetical protein
MPTTTERIRELNDVLRTMREPIGIPLALGTLVITSGVREHGADFITRAVRAVRRYSVFTPDNDPHGEHDFGEFKLDGALLFWKIDYYNRTMQHGSEHPEDAAATRCVLTILLADEY